MNTDSSKQVEPDTQSQVTFENPNDRDDEMHSSIETWVHDLIEGVDEATSSEAFKEWLDVQSRFHDYSHRNTLLIALQCPEATHVAGYQSWQEEFDRHVKEGESAIWIWAPIITRKCPNCGNSPSYHETADCTYDETDPDDWSEGLVGFRPVPVFDVSQTEGEPLPKLDTAATGDASQLVPALLDAAAELAVDVEIVSPESWSHGTAKGICCHPSDGGERPRIEVRDRENRADIAVTLVHEFAHARLHVGVEDDTERSKREVEAEAVAAIVGRYFGIDTSGSAYYLAAWQGDEADDILDRLDRISSTAGELIEVVEQDT